MSRLASRQLVLPVLLALAAAAAVRGSDLAQRVAPNRRLQQQASALQPQQQAQQRHEERRLEQAGPPPLQQAAQAAQQSGAAPRSLEGGGASLAAAADAAGQPRQPPGMPYDLAKLNSLTELLTAHAKFQGATLYGQRVGVPAVRVITGEGHGLGNRVPGIITGFAIALLTGRVFLLESTVQKYWQFPLPCKWKDYESLYAGVQSCQLGHFSKLANEDLTFCGGPAQSTSAPLMVQNCQFDYMLPMLQINALLRPWFDKFFPDGEVFHPLSRYLFSPQPELADALRPYEALSSACEVGMHLRTRKTGTGARLEQFASITRALMPPGKRARGTVFVAADAAIFGDLSKALPGVSIWWNNATASAMAGGNRTAAGNPGSELSAIMDLMLLSRCKQIILTPSSSIGGLAAGYAGIPPVYATHGQHKDPYHNPWFWRSISSEPCFVKGAVVHRLDVPLAKRFRDEHPLFVHHNQCHFDHAVVGYPSPTWECTEKACREF